MSVSLKYLHNHVEIGEDLIKRPQHRPIALVDEARLLEAGRKPLSSLTFPSVSE